MYKSFELKSAKLIKNGCQYKSTFFKTKVAKKKCKNNNFFGIRYNERQKKINFIKKRKLNRKFSK